MRISRSGIAAAFLLTFSAAHAGVAQGAAPLLVGAAKRSITPAQAHIDGLSEARALGAATHLQKFNLGGFGVNPLQNLPDDPFGGMQQANSALTSPAGRRVFTNSQGRVENTQVRAFVIEQAGGDVVMFVMIDAVGAGNVIQKGLKNAVIAAASTQGVTLRPENILFGQSHSHAGADLQGLWGGVPQDWINNILYPAAAAAASEALSTRQPARLSFRQGLTGDFNSYRRPPVNDKADADHTLTLLEAVAIDDGAPIGSILQYNAHPTGIGAGTNPRTPHGDYIQGATDWLESTSTGLGGTALYYNGPIADASGSGGRAGCVPIGVDQPYSGVRCRGEGIADYLFNPANVVDGHELAPTVSARSVEVYLPVTNPGFVALGAAGSFNRYYDFTELPVDAVPGLGALMADLPQATPVAKTWVSRVTLGGAEDGLEIVTIPGETTNTFGDYIRSLASTNVMLLGLTHNSFGYIIPEDEFSYVDQTGDAGLVVPFTGYEEVVSLGPLTAPLLRNEGYNRLFDVDPAAGDTRDLPPWLSSCVIDLDHPSCVLQMLENRADLFIKQYLQSGLQTIAAACHSTGVLEPVCGIIDSLVAVGAPSVADAQLAPLVADTLTAGCDFLDPAHCLFPFPNDHFTTPAVAGSPQDEDNGGTGRRVNFNLLGMPRNTAGKPVDPTEWNRNDGFSPGQMVLTYVPGLAVETNGSITGAVPITDVAQADDADATIFVIDADTGERHPVWAEIDLNANLLLIPAAPQVGELSEENVNRPTNDGRAALIIRPAKNFLEGHRYIVALRNLKGEDNQPLTPSTGFQVCRGDVESSLRYTTPVRERCDHIEDLIETLEDHEPGFDAGELYLTWDFTVASAKNNVGRLAHMRDDAFGSLATVPGTDCSQLTAANAALCAAPQFTVEKVTANPQSGIARRIEGSLTVPSYVVPVEPTPADNPEVNAAVSAFCDNAPEGDFRSGCNDLSGIGTGATLPPNRLFYNPSDATPTDPTQAPYGDGLPDSVGTMSTRFICQIPERALNEGPARAGIYGHGLLDSRVAITYDGVPDLSREYNFMFCAVDLFGFSTGDLGNVASTLVDLSNFPVVPDGSQQGLLNYMFLARLIVHPNGFAADPNFQHAGQPLFDRREVFYDGNSQGGIIGGAVLAISKDVNRGVLGSLGMNYSTLLQRSKDFDPYSTPLYLSYTDPLDRMFLFSMMQMLWDRSENNGYAEHLTTKSDVEGGPIDAVLLNPMYGDQQVTMWSADVMARTMGIPVDYRMVTRAGKTYPDAIPGYPLPVVNYSIADGGANFSPTTSALVNWADVRTEEPVPTGNVPHRLGRDPHDDSAKKATGRCVKAHFLHRNGRLLDVNTDAFKPEQPGSVFNCPAQQDNSGAPGAAAGNETPDGGLLAAIGRLLDAVTAAVGLLAEGEFQAALDMLVGGTQQLVADVLSTGAQQVGTVAGLSLPPPAQDADPVPVAPNDLRAGVAKRAIQVPIGTPLGGYLRPSIGGEYIGSDPIGEMTDNIPSQADGCDPAHPESCPPLLPLPDELRKLSSPYATVSPPSRGYYDSLVAKAVALHDGNDYVVMVKTDFIGMLDEVVQDVKADVMVRRGIDLGDGLIMSATHTHDGPGALANHSTRYFWLAMDIYQHDVYRKLIGQLSDVVVAALDNLRPARIGHGNGLEVEGLNGYRRDRFARYADDDKNIGGISDADALRRRIGVLRIDDAATHQPMAVVINWAAHGIAFDVENQYFSGDMLGAVERETESLMQVPVAMLVQNVGGDVSPRGVSNDNKLQRIESYGKRMAPQVKTIADGITAFQAAPDLRAVSQRIILNPERLGYAPGEYPYPWGGGQCGNDIAVPFVGGGVNDIPGYDQTGGPTKFPYCIPSPPPDALDLADNGVAENGSFYPQDTILTAAKIGNITLLVQPGEPLVEYGVRLMEMAEAEEFNPADTFVWGYSGDHVGYILPDERDDWATFGGAESTTTFWGWKQGRRFIDVSRDLLKALRDEKAAPADEFQVNYALYRSIYELAPAAPVTPSLFPGTVVTQPTDITRFEATSFVFEGGDPVLDTPNVLMQRESAPGVWEAVKRANGEPLDTFFEMHLKYRLISARHLWTVEFEAPKDWAIGRYRFKVSGKANRGTEQAYALESDAFSVAPANTLQLTAPQCSGGVCSADLKYVPQATNYRVIDPRVPANQAAPVRRGIVTFSNGVTYVRDNDADGNGVYQASISGPVTASGVDSFGNTTPNGGTDPDDIDGDGVFDGSDNCPEMANPGQEDADGDGEGDACDTQDNRDSDGDGVQNHADTCPNTPAGAMVDANGCAASQRDTDGDGHNDDVDACPNDAAPGSSDGCPAPVDTTPNAFGFTSVSGVSQNTQVSSNVVTISGIDAPSPISVTGGEYRLDGGVYTSAPGQITNGQTVQVRHTSAATAGATVETVLDIGGVTGKFRSTTAPGTDTDPDAFGFVTQTGVAQSTLITSDTITPVGYNATTTVKAGAGTEYSVGCTGSFVSTQGSISPGQSICVRHTSAATANTLRKTSLQIGTTIGYFSTRTAP